MNVFTDYDGKYLKALKESIAELSAWELEALTNGELINKIDYIVAIAKMRQYTRMMKQDVNQGKDNFDEHEKQCMNGYACQLMNTYFEHKSNQSTDKKDYTYIIKSENADDFVIGIHLYSFFNTLLQSNHVWVGTKLDMASCIRSLQASYSADYDTLDSIYNNHDKYGRSKIKGTIIRNI